MSRAGLVGALLYGAAFTYVAHTTLLAIALRVSMEQMVKPLIAQLTTPI